MKQPFKAREIVVGGMLLACLVVTKEAMAALPNIEPVSLQIMLYTLLFPRLIIPVISGYILIQGLLYGFGVWWVGYLYVWFVLAGVVYLLRKNQSVVMWAAINGIFGVLFGALFAVSYAVMGGIGAGIAWWISGIPFDLLHCAGNFVLTLLLFRPLFKLLQSCKQRFQIP